MDARDPDGKKPTRSEWAVAKAKEYVDKHFAEDIKASEVATHCAMSYFHFSRSFKRACGESFNDYVQRERCRRAVQLLQDPNMNITRVCFDVGFKEVSYFARVFKQCLGTTPSACRGGTNAPDTAAENLGQAQVVAAAEGVEDQADWDFLRAAGCDLAQGYFIAKPMPGADLAGWMADWDAHCCALAVSAP